MKKLTMTLLCGLTALSAQADNAIYLSLGGGVVMPAHNSASHGDSSAVLYSPTATPSTHSQFTLPNVDWENNFKTGFEFDIALGAGFKDNMRVEGEFLYQRIKRRVGGTYGWQETDSSSGIPYADTTSNEIAPADVGTNIYATMINGYFDFKNSTRWTPFAGLGIGLVIMHADGTQSSNNLVVDSTSPPLNVTAPAQYNSPAIHGAAFGWQGKLGLSYKYEDNMSVDLMYRLLGTTDFQTTRSNITTNANQGPNTAVFNVPAGSVRSLLNNSVNLTLRYLY